MLEIFAGAEQLRLLRVQIAMPVPVIFRGLLMVGELLIVRRQA
jgi:hypothetical protein